uniref:Uncharacterized protein n=1 Tax=Sphaerodactylus townsendi TaxID=933632 RepID=A0ACB8EYU9_9SAUR
MIEYEKISAVRVTGGELFEDIVAREYYSEADASLYLCNINPSMTGMRGWTQKYHKATANICIPLAPVAAMMCPCHIQNPAMATQANDPIAAEDGASEKIEFWKVLFVMSECHALRNTGIPSSTQGAGASSSVASDYPDRNLFQNGP